MSFILYQVYTAQIMDMCYKVPPVFSRGPSLGQLDGQHVALLLAKRVCLMAFPTVDGQNPAPPRMIIIPLFIGF